MANATVYLSFALFYTSVIPAPEVDILLTSIFVGVLVDIGLGFVLMASASTGGADLDINIIEVFFKKIYNRQNYFSI